VESLDSWLSVVSFFVALWAGVSVRKLKREYQDIIRGQDLLDELRATASEISDAAADPIANRETLLMSFVSAEATLESLSGRVGGWFVFWGRRGALKSDIKRLRHALKRYQDTEAQKLDRDSIMMGEYLEIQRIAAKVENLLRDRRLER
jgi:hypothetical protein